MRQRDPRQRDDKHLDFIRGLPCAACLDNTATEAAHVRLSDARAAKTNPGVGQKPHDRWAVPLCSTHHRDQHLNNENEWWVIWGIDPCYLALALHSVSGDHEAGEMIIRAYHP